MARLDGMTTVLFPEMVRGDTSLNRTDVMVLFCIGQMELRYGPASCWLSQSTIGRQIGVSRKGVNEACKKLVGKGYLLTTALTTKSRVVSGIIREETASSVTIQTANEVVVLSRDDLVSLTTADISMMPEGLFEKLGDHDARDLVAYLASSNQVPLPPEKTADRKKKSE